MFILVSTDKAVNPTSDMGAPVKIVDLARDMIRLSGFVPDEDLKIVYTGRRPGEKLFEELATAEDKVEKTGHRKIFVGRIPEAPPGRVMLAVSRIADLARDGDEGPIREALMRLVPEASLEGTDVAVEGRRKS